MTRWLTWLEIVGYRNAMSYVMQLADDPHFQLDPSRIRSLHYMMLSHDVLKSPGRYRLNSVFVVDESRNKVVYEPDALQVPRLCEELTQGLTEGVEQPSYVRAAMAHLNLVMIHPFRDGDGRMARCLQTLLLARDSIVAPRVHSGSRRCRRGPCNTGPCRERARRRTPTAAGYPSGSGSPGTPTPRDRDTAPVARILGLRGVDV